MLRAGKRIIEATQQTLGGVQGEEGDIVELLQSSCGPATNGRTGPRPRFPRSGTMDQRTPCGPTSTSTAHSATGRPSPPAGTLWRPSVRCGLESHRREPRAGLPENRLDEAMDTPNGALVRRCFRILNARCIGFITLADITEVCPRVQELIECERSQQVKTAEKGAQA